MTRRLVLGDAGIGGGGEEGADGKVESVGDPGGFVDDQERNPGEAADVVAFAGEGEDTGAVGELDCVTVSAV